MILIFSKDTDISTNKVINWLHFFKQEWKRINQFDFGSNLLLNVSFKRKCNITTFENSKEKINIKRVSAVWLRRYNYGTAADFPPTLDFNTKLKITNNIGLEKQSLLLLLSRNICQKKKWLNNLDSVRPSKMKQLEIASSLGINIPDSIITSSKKNLSHFLNRHDQAIIKPIESFGSHYINDVLYTPFTKIVTSEFFDSLNDIFFPVFCQEYIHKTYEIRSFFLKNRFYSMAMFTQRSDKTKIDFRNFDKDNPIRCIPYKLDKVIETKLRKLMKMLNLNCGSFDLIKSGKKIYFLEVNPVGQFGMVSDPCNYHLEKKLAQALIKISSI